MAQKVSVRDKRDTISKANHKEELLLINLLSTVQLTLTGDAVALGVVAFDALLLASSGVFDGDAIDDLTTGEDRDGGVALLFSTSPVPFVVVMVRLVVVGPVTPLITDLVLVAEEDAVKLTGFSLMV